MLFRPNLSVLFVNCSINDVKRYYDRSLNDNSGTVWVLIKSIQNIIKNFQ